MCVEDGSSYPVMRPLIGFDKGEIIDIAKKIGTMVMLLRYLGVVINSFLRKNELRKSEISTLFLSRLSQTVRL